MKFRRFLDRYYLGEYNPAFAKLLLSIAVFSFLFCVFSGLWANSLVSITNDLVQKENVQKLDSEYLITYEEYYRDLNVKVPKYIYIYFAICMLCFLYFLESTIGMLYLYVKYNKRKNENSVI